MDDLARLSEDAVADRAEVEPSFVRRAVAAGALERRPDGGFSADDAGRLRFLHAWDTAGLAVETVGDLVRRGEISFSFLSVPWLGAPSLLERSYDELTAEKGIDLPTLEMAHDALGFSPPHGSHPVREDDAVLVEWLRTFTGSGMRLPALLRLLRVYSGSLRRMAQAEVEMYESEVESRLRDAGSSEDELLRRGGDVGTRLAELFEEAIMTIYRRHRQHVWLDHSIAHIEIMLENEGLYERLDRPPCVCFVDLTGYTRLTEERGDQLAAELADRLAALVERISRRFDGRPVRWLGDGGMFVFPDAQKAVEAAVEITQRAVADGLPPTHTGIHSGPVVFQDGDIYGRTVNIAARLSAIAGEAGILIGEPVALRLPKEIPLEDLGGIELKGVAEPLRTYRVLHSAAADTAGE